MQVLAVEDIGHLVAAVFAAPARFAGKTFEIASDSVTGRQLELLFSAAAGRPIPYSRFSDEVLAASPFLHKLTGLVDDGRLAGHADLDALRQVKDGGEIGYIRRACAIADKAFEDIVHFIRPGRTEIEVAARLEQVMREAGSEKPSFDTIVASGLRGSMPHGTATEKVIEAGDFVTMDYGAKFEGYCSDITRTVCVGEATARQREVYEAVLGTQEMVLAAIAPGKSGKEIDAASREFLKKYDLAQYFGHGLGHSLGLEIHEEPRLSPSSTCEHLMPGMLITDEPGVYLPGWGGLRIEDTVLVTKTGSERLTKSSKALLEIC